MTRPSSAIPEPFLEDLVGLAAATPAGCFVEVGVYKGGAAWCLDEVARAQGRELYLYDTFTGIPFADPDLGDSHIVGDFGDTSYEEVCRAVPHAIVTAGVFPGTMIAMPPVAFAHIDVDQYRSTLDAVRVLLPQMVEGGVMLFDDYGWLASATAAVDRMIGKDRLQSTAHGKRYFVVEAVQ